MPAEDRDERAERVASIAHSVELGTYRVPAEDVAAAIMSGPFLAYLRRVPLLDFRRRAESSESDHDG